jgi:predicted transglutaminase-like cysteine proteinase
MSAKARAGGAAQWLPLFLFIGFVAASVADTGATMASKTPAIAELSADKTIPAVKPVQLERASQPIIIASLAMSPVAPNIAVTPANTKVSIQLASIDPAATPKVSEHGEGQEPFGLSTSVAPDSIVWFKWRKVTDDIRTQEPALMRCLADESACSPAAARFAAIVKEAREHKGRVRLNFVNQRVNNAIRYTSDMTQWGAPDEWSAPLAGGKGSFETGLGDCEDYAIAKYVALRAVGVPTKQLRVLLVRDIIAQLDHAVLAANEEGHWLILDNRWTAAVEDSDLRRFTPLLTLDEQGVKVMAVSYAIHLEQSVSEVVKGYRQKPGPEEIERVQSSEDGINALGLRPSLL